MSSKHFTATERIFGTSYTVQIRASSISYIGPKTHDDDATVNTVVHYRPSWIKDTGSAVAFLTDVTATAAANADNLITLTHERTSGNVTIYVNPEAIISKTLKVQEDGGGSRFQLDLPQSNTYVFKVTESVAAIQTAIDGLTPSSAYYEKATDQTTGLTGKKKLDFDALTTDVGFEVEHSTTAITTGSVVKIASDAVDTGTAQGTLLDLESSAAVAATITDLRAGALTTGNASRITTNALTTGKGLTVESSSTGLTAGGNLLFVSQTGDFDDATAEVVEIESAHTTGTGLQITGNSITDGLGQVISVNSLSSGAGLRIESSSTSLTTGGNLLHVNATGDFDDVGGEVVEIQSVHTSGTGLQLTMDGVTDGIGMNVNLDALTAGSGVKIASASTGLTASGNLLYVNASADFNDAAGQVVEIESAHTTGVGLQITTNAATDGFGQVISATSLTTGSALDITVGAGTTGGAIKITGGSGIEHATMMKLVAAIPTVDTGWSDAAVAEWVPNGRVGGSTSTGIVKTEFICDLTGLVSSTTLNDIIGDDDEANANYGQITAAVHGTIFAMEIFCMETPAGGDPDIDFCTGLGATGTEDTDSTALAGYVLLHANGAAWAAGDLKSVVTALPADNAYLYMAVGAGGAPGTYSAGKFKITFYGT